MSAQTIGIIGFGLIGQRWALAFAEAGHDVRCHDPDQGQWARFEDLRPGLERDMRAVRANSGSSSGANSGAPCPRPGQIRFCDTLAQALAGVGFVQESGPEKLDLKQQLLAEIEGHVGADVVIASSSSALLPSDMQRLCRHPERIVLGHPFNPAHLMPLVEVVGGAATDPAATETARALYAAIGKQPVVMQREVTGHIALRLMGGLWREAIAMIREGVASAADIDRAFIYGPGVKWTLQGSFISNHLGAAGIEEWLEKYGPSYQAIWDDLGDARFDAATRALVAQSTRAALAGRDDDDLRRQRDAGLVEILQVVARHGAL